MVIRLDCLPMAVSCTLLSATEKWVYATRASLPLPLAPPTLPLFVPPFVPLLFLSLSVAYTRTVTERLINEGTLVPNTSL